MIYDQRILFGYRNFKVVLIENSLKNKFRNYVLDFSSRWTSITVVSGWFYSFVRIIVAGQSIQSTKVTTKRE